MAHNGGTVNQVQDAQEKVSTYRKLVETAQPAGGGLGGMGWFVVWMCV